MDTSVARTGRAIPSARRYLGATVLAIALGSVVSVGIVGGALSQILDGAEHDVDSQLEANVLDELGRSAKHLTMGFDLEFDHAQTDVEYIRDETLAILENPVAVDPLEAERYTLTPEGSYITKEVDDGAAMYYSAINVIGPEQKEKALQFSRLDPLLRFITAANPLVVQSYVNTYDSMLRMYPNFPVSQYLPPATDVRDFSFFYLADGAHDPSRSSVWTSVYVDPVGQGWITSVISPVYRGDVLEAVAAVDIRVQDLIDQILTVPEPFDGYSLLVDAHGVIIAMPPELEDLLDLAEVTTADYSDFISTDQFKSNDFDIDLRSDTQELAAALATPHGVDKLAIGGHESYVAWETLPRTGWRMVVVTPTAGVDALFVPGDRTSSATRYAFAVMVGTLLIVLASIFAWLFHTSRRVTRQFAAIDRATEQIAQGEFHPTLPHAPIAELERTGHKILEMGVRLDQGRSALRERSEEVRANEQRYRAIFENVAEAVLTVNAAGIIVDANEAARDLFTDPLGGRTAQSVVLTDSWSIPGRHLVELVTPSGERKVLEFNSTSTVMPGLDHESGFTISVRDLTREVESQRLLEVAREDAERTARLKDSLLSSMSHEIRTPMNGVIGILSLMADGELPPEARQQLDVARRSAEDLLVLLNDVLDLSKLEANHIRVNPQSVLLREIIEGVIQLHQPLEDEQRDVVVLDIDQALPLWTVVDPTRVRQVLMNLLSNALKFTRDGAITVRVHAVGGAPTGTNFDLRCEVADTGSGIAPDMQALLFRPFTQVDTLTDRRHPGTGLGLAIAKRLVEAMGGQIGLHSAVGVGSVFWFTVPAHAGLPVEDSPAVFVRPDSGPSLRTLVAEDNDVNRMVLVRMLERLGHTVVEAVNGREAIEIAQAQEFDVILMDVQMPVTSGIDATKALRTLGGRHARIPILAVTANVLPEQLAQYVRSGMTGALPKPLTLDQLDAALRRLVPRTTPAAETTTVAAGENAAATDPAMEATMSDLSEPLFDMGAIRELRSTLGETGSATMRELFPASLSQRRAEIAAALVAGDHDAARKAAHSVKGMAGSLGARALQHHAERMQHADDQTLPGLVAEFERLAEATLAAFEPAWTIDRHSP